MPRYKMVDGVTIQLTAEEETARDTEEAAWDAGAVDRAFASMRESRDRLLSETDFYALSDVTMSSDMTTYRAALRDLPATTSSGAAISGSPTADEVNEATWPTKP